MTSLASTLWERLGTRFLSLKIDDSPGWRAYREAEACYRRFFAIEETDNTLYAALDHYGRALEYMPEEPAIFRGLAKTCMHLGLFERAERNAKRALQGFEGRRILATAGDQRGVYESTLILAGLAAHRGDWSQASTLYADALPWGGFQSAKARLGLASALWHQVQTKTKVKSFESPACLIQVLWLVFTGAPAYLSELVTSKVCLTWPLLLFWLFPQTAMVAFLEESGQRESALNLSMGMALSYPGLASLGLGLGELYRDQGDKEWARSWFERVLERHPMSLEALANLVQLAEHEGRYDEMVALTQKMLVLKPSDPQLWCQLANAHYYVRNYREALNAYESAFHLSEDSRWRAIIAQGMGNIQATHLDNAPAAIAYYEIAMALNPGDLESHLQLGLMYFQQENYANAELVYKKALVLDAGNPRIHSNLGYLRWMAEDMDVAVAYYQKAIALDPVYEVPLNNLGVIYLDMLGKAKEALQLFEQSVEVAPEYALAHYNLGRACCFLGERHAAALHFRRARELNHHNHELDNDDLTERINQLFD
jgi:tetratricopeptide (TPR) repeat protein